MFPIPKNAFIAKVLVPVVYGCEQKSAIHAAHAIAGDENVLLSGFIYVANDLSLSTAAVDARKLRQTLKKLYKVKRGDKWAQVTVSHNPWEDLVNIVKREDIDLLLLEWPCHFEALKTSVAEIFSQAPCNIAIVNQHIGSNIRDILLPIRGGPYAELSLRIALSIRNTSSAEISSLHIFPNNITRDQDVAFKGVNRVLKSLPEIKWEEVVTDNPINAVFEAAKKHDLLIMGASARPVDEVPSIGPVAEKIMQESQHGVIVVKTKLPYEVNPASEEAGQTAISVLVDKWFAENTFHADEFADLKYLLSLKEKQNLTISLALPALNEEQTVGKVIRTIKNVLMKRIPLLDEIVLIDSNSTDRTRQIAKKIDVPVYIHQEVLSQYGARKGKGEALWKSLYCTRGDIIIWIDTDIVNIHPRFIYGLIGPLLLRPEIDFVKGFYRRPLKVGNKMQAGSGGRVTELTARPLLNLFYPELSGMIQPLSGEYGGRRKVLEQMPFFSGYGVEIGLLIDMLEKFGLRSIAQVDLQERIHHNQPLEALGKMSFAIIQAVIRKLEGKYGQSMLENINKTMKMIRHEQDRFFLDIEEIAEGERPPMIEISEYQQR
ncbi:glucosyl-3-phosphoglycerate synthase [Candidatus Villigracilis saccharophilus]|uniref:glucosyl-3-phosphoglycerate synthase n=1 Tax=Candidatus Villigracilis saccharophilus TaxID=3140684 RepID=UPI0031E86EE7